MPAIAGARKARLSIPRVQLPKNPQQRVGRGHKPYSPRSGLAQRVVAPAPPASPSATTPAQSSNAVPSTQSEPTAPLSNAPSAPPAATPKGLFDLPAYTPSGEDPRDASYWANVSKLKFSAEQDYAKTQLEQQRADTSYNDALQTAIRNRAGQQRTLGENAIRGNLSASGWLDRNEAEDTTAYTQERSSAQLGKTEEDAAREATRKAIQQGFSLDAAAELGEAAARLAQRRQEEAENSEGIGSGGEEETPAASRAWTGDAPTGKAAGPFRAPTSKKHKSSGSGGTSYVAPKNTAARAALSKRRKAG